MRITSLFGLPAHILFVHIPVVLVPLVLVGTVAMLWSSMLRRFGWLIVVLAGAALVGTVLATQSGKALRRYVTPTALVRQHTRIGGNLTIWAVLLFGLVVAAVAWDWITARRVDAVSVGPGSVATVEVVGYRFIARTVRRVTVVLTALSVVVAVVATYWVIRIGHSGARASWSTVQHRIDTGQRIGRDFGR